MKSFKLLKNVKTHWLSMLSPLKHVMVEYKCLIVKMHFDLNKSKFVCDNLELLCDLLILGLSCVMPTLEVVHSLVKYVQCQDVFIMDFLDVINLIKVELFRFYIDPFSSFDNSLFDDFTRLFQQSSDVLPISWCSNLVELQDFLSFNIVGQIFHVHACNLTNGSQIKVRENDFNITIIALKISCIEATQTLISELKRKCLE